MALEVLLPQGCFGGPWGKWSIQQHLQQKAEASKQVQMGVTENLSREEQTSGHQASQHAGKQALNMLLAEKST